MPLGTIRIIGDRCDGCGQWRGIAAGAVINVDDNTTHCGDCYLRGGWVAGDTRAHRRH